jgi:AhpD family alkylhydroperoxidase
MEHSLYPEPTKEIAQKRNDLAPETLALFRAFSQHVFVDGALSAKTKDLIAIAVAHTTQCPWCIRSHTKRAILKGATGEEIMEAIWVAAEMRAGAAISHSAIAIDAMTHETAKST